MGALHDGHRSLVERAVRECGHVAVTIFVNPLQFDSAEDLARYPRDRHADLERCAQWGAGTVFEPEITSMIAPEGATTVTVKGPGTRWEAAVRPGHFDAVATVVAKLFSLCGPSLAYFGEKDYQQLAVVRRMVADLFFPVHVVGCPTVRDADGLAFSSRNERLSAPERRAARVLWRALGAGTSALAHGESDPELVAGAIASVVHAEPLASLDYAAAVDPEDLSVPRVIARGQDVRLIVAATVGSVHLVDNCEGFPPSRHGPSLSHDDGMAGEA